MNLKNVLVIISLVLIICIFLYAYHNYDDNNDNTEGKCIDSESKNAICKWNNISRENYPEAYTGKLNSTPDLMQTDKDGNLPDDGKEYCLTPLSKKKVRSKSAFSDSAQICMKLGMI